MHLQPLLQADHLIVLQARAFPRQRLRGDGFRDQFIELRDLVGAQVLEPGRLAAVADRETIIEGRHPQLAGGGKIAGDQQVEHGEFVGAELVEAVAACCPAGSVALKPPSAARSGAAKRASNPASHRPERTAREGIIRIGTMRFGTGSGEGRDKVARLWEPACRRSDP
ncbi:MAG: hypothetical protein WDM96_06365 [Lacunisphaera sp.]